MSEAAIKPKDNQIQNRNYGILQEEKRIRQTILNLKTLFLQLKDIIANN